MTSYAKERTFSHKPNKQIPFRTVKFGRNEPCPCGAKDGNGNPIKYKKHCLPKEQGFINIDGEWKSKKEIDAKIAERTQNLKPANSRWDMK